MSPAAGHGSHAAHARAHGARDRDQPPSSSQHLNYSSNDDSQDTTATHDSDRVFTPPESDSGASSAAAQANGHASASSQESQLFQLSQLAAAQQKMAEGNQARKRTADGMVKHTRDSSSSSPVRKSGHSRNASAASAASTTGSRIGEVCGSEAWRDAAATAATPGTCVRAKGLMANSTRPTQLSAELKAKLSYAMIKVNNGWQSHTIDEVESLASQTGSPASSTSTVHGRYGASASPRVPVPSARHGTSSAGISPVRQQPPSGRAYDPFRRDANARPQHHSASPPSSRLPMLAPPAPIQPGRPGHTNPRRSSGNRHAPAFLSNQNSPQTPAHPSPSPLQTNAGANTLRTPQVDPVLFSPHQNVREQEALETLLFMSSPGNSANLKHPLPPPQTSNPSTNTQRTALPTSRLSLLGTVGQARKQLPTARQPMRGAVKRVGFEKSPGTVHEMDVDEHYHSPRSTPRRKNINGTRLALSVPSGLSGPTRSRPKLQDDDIERMLDRVADDSSDSEGEITLPRGRRRDGAEVLEA